MFKKLILTVVIASLVTLSQSVMAKKTKQFSLEKIVEMKSVADVVVSPNGEHLAYLLKVPRDVYVDEDGKHFVELHVIDKEGNSRPFITGKKIIDVGTGPGLPGMILAICLPEHDFTLLDSNGKKTRFLTQVKMEMGLTNVTVANERVENHVNQGAYDHVTSRAFASLEDMINWCLPLPSAKGNFLAMKGEKINIENIAKTVEDGFIGLKNTFDELHSDFKSKINN